MKEQSNCIRIVIFASLLFLFTLISCNYMPHTNKAPVAEKISKELTIHGDTRIDNYYWMNDREDPKVIQYLKDENTYTQKMMKEVEPLEKKLYDEIVARIKQDDESVPYKDHGYWYYTRFEKGKEYPIFCRKKENLEAPEQVILNVNELAVGHAYYNVASFSISPDNRMMVFGVDTLSRRKYTLYFKNLDNNTIFDIEIKNTSGAGIWANDNKTVFYTIKDDTTLRAYLVKKHQLGTSVIEDNVVFEENDETFSVDIYKTKSDKYLIIGSYSTLSTECRFLEADKPGGSFKIIQTRERDHEYSVSHYNGYFYILTNYKAKNFRLMKTPVYKTAKENWVEVIPHRDSVFLEGIDIFKDYLVVSERQDGLTKLRIIKWNDFSEHFVPFDEDVYVANTSVNPDFDTDSLRFSYSSLTTPNSVFSYNMKTGDRKLLKQQEVIGSFKSSDYISQRLYVKVNEHVSVPIDLVYRKDLDRSKPNPLLLYGYGSYGYTIDPYFSSVRLSLLDRGFIYAIAHIRGEQIYGRSWYEDGKLLNKKNTFTDFIDCADYLVAEKYTDSNMLYALGGSAGGLLMGAIVNMRPELFKGVIAAVPFVDVVTTMLDENIPLTTSEYDEWGNPNDKKYYDYILSYSPYDNVVDKEYPNLLVTTGLHDSQVQYWEPAKWVAKIREMNTGPNLILLHTNMEAGHGGASGRFEKYKETALEYSFLLMLQGTKD